jgi:hypothetical protein
MSKTFALLGTSEPAVRRLMVPGDLCKEGRSARRSVPCLRHTHGLTAKIHFWPWIFDIDGP